MRRFRPLLLPTIIVILMVGIAVWIGSRQARQDPVRDHSVMRANEWGTKALAELCRRNGLRVSAWSRPLTLLTERQKVLCLFDPSRQPTQWELDKLVEWVKSGGVLIIGAHLDEADNLLGRDDEAGPDERLLAAFGLAGEAKGAATSFATYRRPGPETFEVSQVYVPGPYRLRALQPGDLDRRNEEFRRRNEKAKPLTRLVSLPWEALLADSAGNVLMAANCDRGRVYALSEVEVLANANLARNDNVVLAANLLYGPGAPVVHFDEHLHWVRTGLSDEAAELDPTRAFWALRLALLALALYFVGQMFRFGAPVPLKTAPRRSALEFVEALADMYRRAEARAAVLGILRETFRQRLAAAVGLSPETPGPALAAAVARQRPVAENQLAGLLERLDDPRGAEKVTEADLLKLARLMATYEEAVTHGR